MVKVNVNPPHLTAQEIERFWRKVYKAPGHGPAGDCWPWIASRRAGYGKFCNGGVANHRSYGAHRVALFLATGIWTNDLVCHTCDFRACCNPSHLFVGNQFDNMRDAKSKGRINPPYGERQGRAKLTQQNVLAIRARYRAGGITQKVLAREFGVSRSHVSEIINAKTWGHLTALHKS